MVPVTSPNVGDVGVVFGDAKMCRLNAFSSSALNWIRIDSRNGRLIFRMMLKSSLKYGFMRASPLTRG